jgi:hypothetical protein
MDAACADRASEDASRSTNAAACLDIGCKLRETPASVVEVPILVVESRVRELALVAVVAGLALVPARADEGTEPFGIAESLARGRFTLELRPRYNRIDETDHAKRTEGGTVRALAGWRSAPWRGLRLTVEAIHADHIGRKNFNDDPALLATSAYPLLPDPRYSGVNQAHVEYAGDSMRLRAGRQVVRVDNQRWVSDNGFRQIPQVFDGVAAAYTGIDNTQLEASRFWRVRTTSGVTNSLALSVLRAAWNPLAGHSLAAYAYFHDQAQNGAFTGFADSSYRVAGVKAEGAAMRFDTIDVPYIVEYAQQRPYAGGDYRVRANYWRAGAGLASTNWTARYDYEVKGSNSGRYGLQMPLTDFTLYGESHRFRADYGGRNLGRENDIGLSYELESWAARLQHARYDPGTGTPDPGIRKTWLTLTYTY